MGELKVELRQEDEDVLEEQTTPLLPMGGAIRLKSSDHINNKMLIPEEHPSGTDLSEIIPAEEHPLPA